MILAQFLQHLSTPTAISSYLSFYPGCSLWRTLSYVAACHGYLFAYSSELKGLRGFCLRLKARLSAENQLEISLISISRERYRI